MKKKIAPYALLLLACCCCQGLSYADDYIDDVYYWAPEDNNKMVVIEKEVATPVLLRVRKQVVTTPVQTQPKIEFLDDEITRQNPDTVVRAVIRR